MGKHTRGHAHTQITCHVVKPDTFSTRHGHVPPTAPVCSIATCCRSARGGAARDLHGSGAGRGALGPAATSVPAGRPAGASGCPAWTSLPSPAHCAASGGEELAGQPALFGSERLKTSFSEGCLPACISVVRGRRVHRAQLSQGSETCEPPLSEPPSPYLSGAGAGQRDSGIRSEAPRQFGRRPSLHVCVSAGPGGAGGKAWSVGPRQLGALPPQLRSPWRGSATCLGWVWLEMAEQTEGRISRGS